MTKERQREIMIMEDLQDILDECLESGNQEGSFKIKSIDLEKRTGVAEFTIAIDDEGNVLGFNAY